jgi:hypothetical protein
VMGGGCRILLALFGVHSDAVAELKGIVVSRLRKRRRDLLLSYGAYGSERM